MSDQIATPSGASAPEQTAPSAAPTVPTDAEIRKFKVKVDGKELEVDERTLTRDYQKYKSADNKFQQAAELIKHADLTTKQKQAEMDKLINDPEEYFKKKGKTAKQWAEEFLIADMKRQAESPTEKRARLAEERTAQLEADAKARDERDLTEKQLADKRQHEMLTSQAVTELDIEIPAAIKAAGLEGINPRFIAAVADEMLSYLEAKDGRQKLTAADAVKAVRNRAEFEGKALLAKLPTDQLVKLLSDAKRMDDVRRYSVDQVMDSSPTRRSKTTEQASTSQAKPKALTTEEYFKNLDKKFT